MWESNWSETTIFIFVCVLRAWAAFPEELGSSRLSSSDTIFSLLGQAQFEMPYVVRLHNFHQLSAPQPCFTFSHPNRGGFLHGCPLTKWGAHLPGFFPRLSWVYLASYLASFPGSCLGFTKLSRVSGSSSPTQLFPNRSYDWQQSLLYLGVSCGGEHSAAWFCRLLWDCALSGHHSEWVSGAVDGGLRVCYLDSLCI